MTEAEERALFEEWISSPPLDMPTHRFPDHVPTIGGEYSEDMVEAAWQAWIKRAREEEKSTTNNETNDRREKRRKRE